MHVSFSVGYNMHDSQERCLLIHHSVGYAIVLDHYLYHRRQWKGLCR